eukprot:gnl/TRDRNA2_/TRDRNA2_176951_c0_seq2.p1 gnl/TRDRNA2_/TRDRNA2_176951_c0~~gnl/TRDRNA2_/TRDRNA2_176951_c0_seq2.p1  ORF type:complete len:130 (+),score=16.92 gnl/TRDRNA2_/TRDRNA2_176951_c0_seq2:91-480(+)
MRGSAAAEVASQRGLKINIRAETDHSRPDSSGSLNSAIRLMAAAEIAFIQGGFSTFMPAKAQAMFASDCGTTSTFVRMDLEAIASIKGKSFYLKNATAQASCDSSYFWKVSRRAGDAKRAAARDSLLSH